MKGAVRVSVNPEFFVWGRKRARLSKRILEGKFSQLSKWESGEVRPTLKQLEKFASVIHLPIGYFFLSAPVDEFIPIPDFRVFPKKFMFRPSPGLLETIYACQEKQEWYKRFVCKTQRLNPDFIGSTTINSCPKLIADRIGSLLKCNFSDYKGNISNSNIFISLVSKIESFGVLVMVNGLVGNNCCRYLDPCEFFSFSLSDKYSPLIFINNRISKEKQLFVVIREFARLWSGNSALSNSDILSEFGLCDEELWCNKVAQCFFEDVLGDRFECSGNYNKENEFGGDFYRKICDRMSINFIRALLVDTLEGNSLYRDAMRMIGISKVRVFNNLGYRLGILRSLP